MEGIAPSGCWRGGLARGRHEVPSPRSRAKAPRIRNDDAYARVRHWRCPPASNDARNAPCMRATASRHVVCASSQLAAHERREGLRAARTAQWRRSPGRLGWRPATSALLCRRRGGSDGNAQGSGDAMVPVSTMATRDYEHRSRAPTPRRSRHPEVAPGRADPASSAGPGTSLLDALASTTEATRQPCSVSLEEPGVRIKHETPGHPSRDVY